MNDHGYYHQPAISGDKIYFVSEDDLWTVAAGGGVARRLTSGLGAASYPAVSHDGKQIAFSSSEEGVSQIYLMPSDGGPSRRLTYSGKLSRVIGWTPPNHRLPNQIIYASTEEQPFLTFNLRVIPHEQGASIALNLGPAEYFSIAPDGRGAVLARLASEAAYWKRYRGGTAGDLWIDRDGSGEWRRLVTLEGNPSRPLWIGTRIYFISDHEGIGNIYSCTPDGKDLRQHTDHGDFYARNAASDGRRIVYQAGADLFVLDPGSGRAGQKIEIEYRSARTQRNRKFIDAAKYLESYAPHPSEESIVITSRGKIAVLGSWEGPVRQVGEPAAGRHRLATWLYDGTRIVSAYDAGGAENLAIHRVEGPAATEYLRGPEISRVVRMKASPRGDQVAFTTVRNELVLADFAAHSVRVLDRNRNAHMGNFNFSPDGRFIAYNWAPSRRATVIRICRIEDGATFNLTRPVREDFAPVFDPEGTYLYFLSAREFNPVYDKLHFDLGFPKAMRPYAVALRKEVGSRFAPTSGAKTNDAKPVEIVEVTIDFGGIEDRIEAFPVPEGIYEQIGALKGKVIFTSLPVEGSLDNPSILAPTEAPEAKAKLEAFDFETRQLETWVDGITSFTLSLDRERLVYRAGNRLRVIKTSAKPDSESAKEEPGRKSGWIDLKRIRTSIDPLSEWRQMFREAWRMQREQYWIEDMAEVDWKAIHDQYLPLVDRVGSRSEFEDLLWEMQGELGASHAYAFGGDFRRPPAYLVGFLGADIAWNESAAAWQITHIVRGDPSDSRNPPPLMRPGINLAAGAAIIAVNNQAVTRDVSPAQLLVHQAGAEIVLTVADQPGGAPRDVLVETSADDTLIRYREWVEKNRAWVHEHSGGRCGYVHIPDMGPWGYAEFHRLFLAELDQEGLVIDLRYNRGGHVSSLLLEKLARKRRAYNQSRWFGIEPWPQDSPAGPMVALTNQHAGSDGDIFSHGFKLLKLGPLIGKRTWGGVIGIWPRHMLADGGLTTQPEFAFWFDDVGWSVENRGVDPDIEVEYPPHDYAAGRDPQLERGLAELMKLIGDSAKTPEFEARPSRLRRSRRST
ncbi:MAG: S41 family peptidase [Candidatus Binataceae bacterium]